jgi:hypothetical protein
MADGGQPERTPLCDEVVDLLGSGVVMVIATRDAALEPECVPALGARAHRDRRTLTVFVSRALLGATLANIEDNGQVAITLTRPSDEQSMQIKGRGRTVRDASDADRPIQEQLRGAKVEQLAGIGMPRHLARRMAFWPSVAIDIDVTDVFVQTPGPTAGLPLTR